MFIFTIITLKNATIPRAKRSHPPRSSRRIPATALIRTHCPHSTPEASNSKTPKPDQSLPTFIHIPTASQHEKNRAVLPSPIDLVPAPLGGRQLRRAAIVRFGAEVRLPLRSDFGDWQGGNNDNDVLGLGLGSSRVVEPAPEAEAVGRATSPISSSIDGDVITQYVISPISPPAAVPGACPSLASSMSPTSVIEEGHETDKTFTKISILESYLLHRSDDDNEELEPSQPLSEEDRRMQPFLRLFSFQENLLPKTFDNALPQQQQPLAITSSHTYHDLSHRPVPHEIFDIAPSQLYNGLYPLNEKLHALMGRSAMDDKITQRVDETVWATALAVAFVTNRPVHRKVLSNVTLSFWVAGSKEMARGRGIIRWSGGGLSRTQVSEKNSSHENKCPRNLEFGRSLTNKLIREPLLTHL
ncbi:hypothetical protein PQX77_017184 [Marasmius sp. AFHP31]|nr:hypothetical protein PQX77_017184 [Marasmius sp. AFHP31]